MITLPQIMWSMPGAGSSIVTSQAVMSQSQLAAAAAAAATCSHVCPSRDPSSLLASSDLLCCWSGCSSSLIVSGVQLSLFAPSKFCHREDQFRLVGENVAKVRTDVMKEQLATFRSQLEEFARKHKSDIRKNPIFRQQFHEMCAKVGVDPLASNKGVWAELLGIGDFYYELGVQIVDICIATRSHNGGLIDLLDLRKLLCQKRKATLESLSEDDCLRAISKLKILGSGFEVISVGRRKLVRSVPTELNKDHSGILGLAQAEGYVTVEQVEKEFSWSTGRAIDALETLLKEGLAMIDDGHRDGKRRYWFPCVTVSSDTTATEAKS
ncbi:hypothetical protein U9M48_014967 [Paspalum notatum var. saurae]|uniref:Vacuolar protein sorting-associated protein n=1 Tax=Paspalum notatum var. saurae TaxID=547442 RepID=A0AAQ3T2J6_PASNO